MFIFSIVICTLLPCLINGAKILTISTMPAYSHFLTIDTLLQVLASCGHNITFVSPIGKHKENVYEHVLLDDILESYQSLNDIVDNDKYSQLPDFGLSRKTFNAILHPSVAMLGHEKFQKILHKQSFDLIIIDYCYNPIMFGLGHHFRAPMVALVNYGYDTIGNEMMTSPTHSSFIPEVITNYGSRMTFFERLINVLLINLTKLNFYFFVLDAQNEILEEYLPNQPHLKELFFNTSLMLSNTHSSFKYPQPNQPSIVDVGGMHIKNSSLPDDLQTLLDESKQGFVYFSLGSFVNHDELSKDKLEAIFNALKKINMKVIFKLPDNGQRKSDNFIFRDWLPQQAILAHRNIKLFITHGGIHSLMEAVHYGVPIVGLPVMYDQKHNMRVSVENGVGVSLNFHELQEEKFYSLILEVLETPEYGNAVRERSKAFRDRPLPPMDTAIFWVEYVIRNKGAPFFKSQASELTWYQYYSLDVIGFIILGICLLGWVIRRCCYVSFRTKRKQD